MIDETKIMQLADGTLPQEEYEEVKKAIESDPKLKELYKSYQETGELLFNLGNEIKSQPLPKNLQEKVEILKSWKKPIKQESGSFNFFGLFKMQYAGIAAAFCLFFVGGFFTKSFLVTDGQNQLIQTAKRASEKIEVPKKLKMRSLPSEKEDLQTRIQNLYLYFNEDKFLSEISEIIDQLEANDVYESSLKDHDGKVIKFVLVEDFNSNSKNCKKVRFNEPLRLSNIDEGTDVSLDLCKINEQYELSSINFENKHLR